MNCRPAALVVLALLAPVSVRAAAIADATGRVVQIPDQVERVLPTTQAAAVLLEALAPDRLLGWPQPVPGPARALLLDHPAVQPDLPAMPTATGDMGALKALKPDLILQYGPIGPAEVEAARSLADRTGVPTLLLDGALRETPHVLRELGAALHRTERGETLARLAETMLAMRPPGGSQVSVAYARGPDGLDLAAPDSEAASLFKALGWTVLAPSGDGRAASVAQVAALDPDVIVFDDPAMRDAATRAPGWRKVRAVQEGHAFVAPSLPFGWIARPASLNRLLGLAWLSGADPVTAAAMFGAVVYGQAPNAAQLAQLRTALRPLAP